MEPIKTTKNHEKQTQKSSTSVLPRKLLINYLVDFNSERSPNWWSVQVQNANFTTFSHQLKYRSKRILFRRVFEWLSESFLVVFNGVYRSIYCELFHKKVLPIVLPRITAKKKAPFLGP